jgi:hypothetical protein
MSDVHNARCEADLIDRLRAARNVTAELMDAVMHASLRLPRLNKAGRAVAHLQGLLRAEAWTDAALAWAAIEAPQWRLRRLVHDDGLWLCALSRAPNLPLELDDTADGAHPLMPLAVMLAAVEARTRLALPERSLARAASLPAAGRAVCCDNFG